MQLEDDRHFEAEERADAREVRARRDNERARFDSLAGMEARSADAAARCLDAVEPIPNDEHAGVRESPEQPCAECARIERARAAHVKERDRIRRDARNECADALAVEHEIRAIGIGIARRIALTRGIR
jgi:hypothetical protein